MKFKKVPYATPSDVISVKILYWYETDSYVYIKKILEYELNLINK